ncbi:PAB-dependent poly(A)-specific ribonuclease subunit PAN3 [Fusarium oxysporum]|uniref:PAN2-PAN3 deadenylation complex subunit PAN3 n=1 Tax=Fusarium oxysporum TaxID=5507 RepID=A0A420MWF9_FUSOX|nr:PAB-dependent poly(A)-specific ribonuclease subunit PAN3 [Fusarium oxysporum]
MATSRYQTADLRRQVGSPRPKGRENKDTLCRNVLIYGHCRYEDQGCAFSHDQNKNNSNSDLSKKALNVESPSFTPASVGSKKATFSSQAASAPAFTPRGLGSATPVGPQDGDSSVFNPATVREFTPDFDVNSTTTSANGSGQDGGMSYDPFTVPTMNQGITTPQYNPYAEDPGALGGHGPGYFPAQNAFAAPVQPLQHHLYFPAGPRRDDLMPYHRVPHDFFLAEKDRIEIVNKLEATGQVLPNSQLPQLDNYHNLVPLDTTHRKNANIFGYPSWVYKATQTKSGHTYCLRRLEGYRLTNENAIRLVKEWRRINNGSVVSIIDAFTTRAFGDSSLIFVQNYFPLSKTLVEAHLTPSSTHGTRFQAKTPIAENVLWGYISQIANALQAIHSVNLAARCIDPSKIILTDKGRIRLSACSILDVVQYDAHRSIQELQQEDFIQFGRLLLCLTTNTLPIHLTNFNMSLEQLSRVYSVELRDTVLWLLTPQQPPAQKGIEEFVRGIAGRITSTFDQNLQAYDKARADVMREVENGRVARLMMKLATVNERYDFNGDQNWSENGERYMLKLFRDYVFHQVDSNGNPVLDMGHMLRCMSKLDIGTEERICLTSRDEQTSFLVSYKELKKMLANSYGELVKASKSGRSF